MLKSIWWIELFFSLQLLHRETVCPRCRHCIWRIHIFSCSHITDRDAVQGVCNTSHSSEVLLWNQAEPGLFGLFTKERWEKDSGSLQSPQTFSVPGGFLRSRLAQQLCRTFQKVSLSHSFFLLIAPLVTFSPFGVSSLFFSLVFCCVSCLYFLFLFSVFSLNFTHLSYFAIFLRLCTHLLPSYHKDWKCLIHSDAMPAPPHSIWISAWSIKIKIIFLFKKHQHHGLEIITASLWWVVVSSDCFSKCLPGEFALSNMSDCI